MTNLYDAAQWLEKTKAMESRITLALETGEFATSQLCEFIRDASRSIINRERFLHQYTGVPFIDALETLYYYLQLNLSCDSAIVMIPVQVSLLESGQLSFSELCDYMHENILIKFDLDVDENSLMDSAATEKDKSIEREFNYLLDQTEEYADKEDYEKAIECIDKALAIAEKEPLLMFDRITMVNNRAYYNCCLGKFHEALADAEKGLAADPENDLLYHTKAEIMTGMGKLQEALRCIDQAILLNDTEDKRQFKQEILSKL